MCQSLHYRFVKGIKLRHKMRLSKSAENKRSLSSGGNAYSVKSTVEYLGKIETLKNG